MASIAVVEWRTTHHNASFQVVPDGDGRCRLVWITDLLPGPRRSVAALVVAQRYHRIDTREREYERVGEDVTRKVDVRVCAP